MHVFFYLFSFVSCYFCVSSLVVSMMCGYLGYFSVFFGSPIDTGLPEWKFQEEQ